MLKGQWYVFLFIDLLVSFRISMHRKQICINTFPVANSQAATSQAGTFPSANFPAVQFPKRQLPCPNRRAPPPMKSASPRTPSLTFGKLPIGKLSLGKSPLEKYLAPFLKGMLANNERWYSGLRRKIFDGDCYSSHFYQGENC